MNKTAQLFLYLAISLILAFSIYAFAGQKMSFEEALQKKTGGQAKTQSKSSALADKFIMQQKADEQMYKSEVDRNILHIQNGLKDNSLYPPHMADPSILNLGRAKDPKAIPILTQVLESYYLAAAREHAARALGTIGDETAIPALLKALDDKDYQVKLASAIALVQLGVQDAAFPMLKKIALKVDMEKWEVDLTSKVGMLGNDNYLANLKSAADKTKRITLPAKALRALSQIGSNEALDILEIALNDKEVSVRISAANGLIQNKKDYLALPVLESIIKDTNNTRGNRSTAIGVLSKVESPEAKTILIKFSSDKDKYISNKAIKMIERMEKR